MIALRMPTALHAQLRVKESDNELQYSMEVKSNATRERFASRGGLIASKGPKAQPQ